MRARAVLAQCTMTTVAALAIAVGVVACNKTPPDQSSASKAEQQSAANKAELEPTAPNIGPPPAQPAPVMPPKAGAVFDQSTGQNPPASGNTTESAPASGNATASGSDPGAKEPMTKAQESTAMPMPAQANDHSTTSTDRNDSKK